MGASSSRFRDLRGPQLRVVFGAMAAQMAMGMVYARGPLTPPMVEGIGYDIREVDAFLSRVADTLELFEKVDGADLQRLRATQYLQGTDGSPQLLVGDQVRAALFTVHDVGGYDTRGVDAAVRRLAETLDYHWSRAE